MSHDQSSAGNKSKSEKYKTAFAHSQSGNMLIQSINNTEHLQQMCNLGRTGQYSFSVLQQEN